MFRRTAAGISNQALFFDVDIVVFVEGSMKDGQTFSKDQAYAGQCNSHSIDVIYWQSIFAIFLPGPKFKFRPLGSKSTLLSIGEDITGGKIRNVYVAMDRDFQLNGLNIKGKGIIYTYGYSWENDIWHPDVLQDVLTSLCSTKIPSDRMPAVKEQIVREYISFAQEVSHAVFADALLSTTGKSFIPRKKHRCCLRLNSPHLPKLNIDKIEEIFQELNLTKEEATKSGIKYKIDPLRDCFGHLLSDFCYQLISYFLRKVAKLPSIAKEYVLGIAIDKFRSKLVNNELPVLRGHYISIFTQ